MTPGQRLFFDVSYTRTQAGQMGITRTVRRLLEEWRFALPRQGCECIAVAFHASGFRELQAAGAAGAVSSLAPAGQSSAARLFRWVTGEFFRGAVVASTALVPWAMLRYFWRVTSTWTFNALSSGCAPVRFRLGDVLFLCDASWNYPVWKAARRARVEGAKVVLLVYDLIPLRHPQFCFPLVPHIFGLWLDQMLRCADAIVCISKATETDLRAYAAEASIPLPPTSNFRLGSDPVRKIQADTVRAELRSFCGPDVPCFVAIGSFEPKKNYDFLLDVFEAMWSRGLDRRLLIMGRETPESAALVARVKRHPEQGQRLLTLFDACDAEVVHAYANGRALVFPSAAEGFGLPLVEARTRGSAVIASNLPVFQELADEGVHFYEDGSRASLAEVVERHSRSDLRSTTPPMSPFLWSDSANEALRVIGNLL